MLGVGLLRLVPGFLQVGQTATLLLELCGQHLGRSASMPAPSMFSISPWASLRLLHNSNLLCQLLQALLHALAAFDHIANLGFQLADLGRGFIELALRLIDLIARVVVRLAQGLEPGFRCCGYQLARSSSLVDDLEAFDTHTVLLGLGLGLLHELQMMLLERDLGV